MAPHHRRTVAVVITSTLVVLAVLTGTLVTVFYKHLDANLKTGQQITHIVPKDTQEGPKAPLNILVMGIDSRAGQGDAIDSEAGMNGSDTNILLHVSADRQTAYGVSIARDTLVTRPDCTSTDGQTIPGGELQQWNKAYQVGGPACTAEQLEEVTGIHVDGYITLDFEGFKSMVAAIDGVQVCIPEDVNDQKHGIVFKAGTQTLKGDQALNYVRERYSTPNSDLGRMKRQQAFISSMISKVVSARTLTRPDKLVRFADAAASSITASPGLDTVHDLVQLAEDLKDIDLTHIRFVTAPVMDYPKDPNRLIFTSDAKALWKRIANDKPLTKAMTTNAISAGNPPSGSTSPSGSPTGTATAPSSPTATPTTDAAQQEFARENGLCA